jgi:Domain of Unknown Function (DUF1080)
MINRQIYFILKITFILISISAIGQKSKPLFNQKNLTGWYAFEPETGINKKAIAIFNVENNMIRCYGKKAGYLMSKKSFKNFKLTVEFKWNTDSTFERKNNTKNSGVMYLIPKDTKDELWPKGIQFQIKEGGATGDFVLLKDVTLMINGIQTKAGNSVTSKNFQNAENTLNNWNTIVITSNNGAITQELNDKIVNEGINTSEKKGRICIQYEGYPIDFKKIEIEKLK